MQGKRVIIIGAVALGPKVACRLKRLQPGFDILMIDEDEYISYGGCGIPYYISGDISDIDELMSTSFHMLRTPEFFEKAKGVRVRPLTRAMKILREDRSVLVKDLKTGSEELLSYDYLVLATGSVPNRLPVPGIDLPGVISVTNLRQARALKERISRGEVEKAVIIGAGAIGCEMAEALSDLWGIETTIVEIAGQVLPGIIDEGLARIVKKHMEDHDVRIYLGEAVKEIKLNGKGTELTVKTDHRMLDADLVVTAVGVHPNSELAKDAGLLVSPRGGIVVNHRLQTSDPVVYAGGDCIEVTNLITGKPFYFPQGSLANRQGRIIATNIAGGTARFEGCVGNFIMKIFDLSVAAAGLSLATAQKEGFDAISAFVVQSDKAHFYPTQNLLYLQLVVDRKTRRILGIQGLGRNGDALHSRINSVAALLPFKATLEDVSNMEISYSPPFASAMDIVNALANTAENILEGLNRTVDILEFERCFFDHDKNTICLDVRAPQNAAPFLKHFGDRWLNIPQETIASRIDEIPRDKSIVVVCNSGARSYEALLQLRRAGINNAANLQGGVAAAKEAGLLNLSEEED